MRGAAVLNHCERDGPMERDSISQSGRDGRVLAALLLPWERKREREREARPKGPGGLRLRRLLASACSRQAREERACSGGRQASLMGVRAVRPVSPGSHQ